LLSILYGLISAIGWGAADFTGGFASKKSSPYQVIFLAEIAGLIPLVTLALLSRESLPDLSALLWSALASTVGTLGLLILYRALADGQMAIAAPVSALLSAVIPVLVGAFTEGLPRLITFLGFGLALASVWVISQNGEIKGLRINFRDLRLPLISGLFFGSYFVLIHQATVDTFLWPLVSARLTGTLVMIAYASLLRKSSMLPKRELWPIVMLGGVLDVVGNGFYVLAAHSGRMDVAAVLGALYPASTILLASVFLKEKIARLQAFGILLALVAIILLTV
jgi:drug/metabolite transporter (DMT)-like permease